MVLMFRIATEYLGWRVHDWRWLYGHLEARVNVIHGDNCVAAAAVVFFVVVAVFWYSVVVLSRSAGGGR
jgi:hypothetical protein